MRFSRISSLSSLSKRSYSSSVLPNLSGLNSSTTLGEVYKRAYTDYKYKLVYPIVGWVGILYSAFWVEYAPKSEKIKALEKQHHLESLKFSKD